MFTLQEKIHLLTMICDFLYMNFSVDKLHIDLY